MIEPFWKIKHDWWINDFRHWHQCKIVFANLLRKHPDEDDEIGNNLRELIESCEWKIKQMKKDYKKIYGVNFNMNRVRDK